VLSLPHQPLRFYEQSLGSNWETILERFQQALTQHNSGEVMPLAQIVYDWLIRPAEQALQTSNVKTLVFVLDGPLRNIPMAALSDGQRFLIEKYHIALTPGLKLLNPQPLGREKLRVLLAGVTEAHLGFAALKHVGQELNAIQSQIPSRELLNQTFTVANLKAVTASKHFPVVHLATHGQFSSQAKETFILAWDQQLGIEELNTLIYQNFSQKGDLNLLVLSACETATGDRRAALGMAGIAIRAGARSTLSTLWLVNDEATASLMSEFYKQLVYRQVGKAEAIQRAQLKLLNNPKYKHPYYWAPYVLIGNWL
jgi:CHAT domain-containing protein